MGENFKKLPGFHPLASYLHTKNLPKSSHKIQANTTSHTQPAPCQRLSHTRTNIHHQLPYSDPMHRRSSINHFPSSPPPLPPSGLCTTPSADHSGRFPITQRTAAAAFPTSHEGDLAMGGYSLPPFSILGSQVHRSSSVMVSITIGTWEPQPHHVAFLQVSQFAFLHIALGMSGYGMRW